MTWTKMIEMIDIPGEYNLPMGQEIEYADGKIFVVEHTGRYLVTEQGVTQIEDKEPEMKKETLYGLLNHAWYLLGKEEIKEARHYIQRAKMRARSQEEETEKLREIIRGIIDNVHYEKDLDGNWYTYYNDKPRAAAATEHARRIID